jgi:outer membrane lipoprotein SlyB
MPFQLMETLQQTGNWGIVRVIPDRQSEADVWVDAEILTSDGETMELMVTVTDSSSASWYRKKYTGTVSKYAYDTALTKSAEPFQGLYNDIANDLLQHYQGLSADEIAALRTITELKFARQFSPEAFDEHLGADKQQHLYVKRLPAENDPVLMRVRQMRERDYMFVDTLQEYYASFARQMDLPYREWRKAYYEEGQALREVQAQSRRRMVGGALAVLGGILAQGSDSSTARTAGAVGIGAGATVFVSGMNKRQEAKVHAEALEEISASMDSEMEPHTIELQERTVTLSGSVNDQYSQWRQVLREIYATETGTVGGPGSP